MVQAGFGWLPRVGALTVGIALAVGAGSAQDKKPDAPKAAGKKADDKGGEFKDELLKLNTVTGEDAQRARLVQFVKDKEKAKKMLAEAAKMMKAAGAKDKPFNFVA